MDIGAFIIGLLLIGFIVFVYWFIYKKYMERDTLRLRYTELYELYKLNEQLKDRGLSFSDLDKFERDILKLKKNRIEEIDEKYKEESKEKKEKGAK